MTKAVTKGVETVSVLFKSIIARLKLNWNWRSHSSVHRGLLRYTASAFRDIVSNMQVLSYRTPVSTYRDTGISRLICASGQGAGLPRLRLIAMRKKMASVLRVRATAFVMPHSPCRS